MGRRKSAAQLQNQLTYAKAREAYKKPAREESATTTRQPKIAVAYKPMAIAAGETAKRYKLQASKAGILFFGQSELGVPDAGAEEGLPRGAQPAKVHAMVSDGTPNLVRSVASKRPYIRYGKGERNSRSQYTYTAPISIQSASALDNEVKTAFAAVKSKLGGPYGRSWFTPEFFILTGSGE